MNRGVWPPSRDPWIHRILLRCVRLFLRLLLRGLLVDRILWLLLARLALLRRILLCRLLPGWLLRCLLRRLLAGRILWCLCGLLRSLRSLLNGCLLYGCLGGRLCVGLPGPVVGQRFSVCGALARGLRAHVCCGIC